jgi:cell division protein FtsI (penicillin-binding protein 3)
VVRKSVNAVIPRWRYYLVMLSLVSLPLILLVKVAQLQIIPNEERGVDFLQAQGDNRSIRQVVVPAYRGLITDRNGEPLAISTPVTAIIANPQQIRDQDLDRLSVAMNTSTVQLRARLKRYRNKSFMYLERQLPTEQAARILDLGIAGILPCRRGYSSIGWFY